MYPGSLSYQRTLLPSEPSVADLSAVARDYAAMLVSVMSAIVDRYERRPGYPYIDTKLDLITGADFDPADPLRGHGTVYGWIQGRGLEALADHCRWLRRHPGIEAGLNLVPRLERMMYEVAANLRAIRARNGGHLFFTMTPEGDPFVLREGERRPIRTWDSAFYGFADTFGAKGLLAVALYRGDTRATQEAREYCHRVDAAIRAGRFVAGEKDVDPDVGPQSVAEPRPQGPFMIQLGTAAVLAEADDPQAVELGLRLIRHILKHHVNVDQRMDRIQPFDLWEDLDAAGEPYRKDGAVICNPGHSIEFAGLGLKFTARARRSPACTPEQRAEIARAEALMPAILIRNFGNGYCEGPAGICTTFDLVARRPVDDHMPWWSLPETIRAAISCWAVSRSGEERRECLEVLRRAHNAFTVHYVRPDLHLMAYQTRSAAGRPVPVIPATADADPGYHTGCSLLDVLALLEEQAGFGR